MSRSTHATTAALAAESAAALRVPVPIDAPTPCATHGAAATERRAPTVATDAGTADGSAGLASAGEGGDAFRRRWERREGSLVERAPAEAAAAGVVRGDSTAAAESAADAVIPAGGSAAPDCVTTEGTFAQIPRPELD